MRDEKLGTHKSVFFSKKVVVCKSVQSLGAVNDDARGAPTLITSFFERFMHVFVSLLDASIPLDFLWIQRRLFAF